MNAADIFKEFGQQTAFLAGELYPDRMKVLRNTPVSDGGGGTKSSWSSIFDDDEILIPCEVLPEIRHEKGYAGEEIYSDQKIIIRFPAYLGDGTRIGVLSKDRLEIQQRGDAPATTYIVDSIQRFSDMLLGAKCNLKN